MNGTGTGYFEGTLSRIGEIESNTITTLPASCCRTKYQSQASLKSLPADWFGMARWPYGGIRQYRVNLGSIQQHTNVENVFIIGGTMIADSMEFINAYELVGDKFCVSSEDGQELYQSIESALREGKRAYISFKDVAEISSAFLESAIGRLYQSGYTEEEIKKRVIVYGLSDDDNFIFERIKDRIKDFLKDPARFEAVMNEVLGEGDE
jgi:hypothetical protein